MEAEIEQTAQRLGLSFGAVVWTAWEAAKTELYAALPSVDGSSHGSPPHPNFPSDIDVPDTAPALEALPVGEDKVARTLDAPDQFLDQLRRFSLMTDRSMSWLAQQSYTVARARIASASRT